LDPNDQDRKVKDLERLENLSLAAEKTVYGQTLPIFLPGLLKAIYGNRENKKAFESIRRRVMFTDVTSLDAVAYSLFNAGRACLVGAFVDSEQSNSSFIE